MFPKAFRRPLVSTAAAVAVIGVTAAGYASTNDNSTNAAYATGQTTAEQAYPLSRNDHLEVAQSNYTIRSAGATVRAEIAAQQQKAAAAKAAAQKAAAARVAAQKVAAQKAAALVAARQQAAATAARAQARAAVAARAQSDPKSIARLMLAQFGWGSDQFGCLDSLWTKESGWNYQASNGSSGAYGIPQSLPGSKMASAGADWATNPATQIKWGLGYIQASYGSPCAAWSHSQAVNWY